MASWLDDPRHPFSGLARNAAAANAPKTEVSGALNGIANAFSQLQAPASQAVRPEDLQKRISMTPGYQYTQNEAVNSVLGNASALGLRQSGTTIKDIGNTVGNQIAFPVFQDYLNRLTGLAGAGGQTASGLAGGIGNLATTSGAINSNLLQQAGDARAAGSIGQAQAWNNSLGGITSILGDYIGSQK